MLEAGRMERGSGATHVPVLEEVTAVRQGKELAA
jgi:hypothetical protein